ncbi:uncharacterized protein LOC128461558 [Pleuronectes platessa]|uniref:uncharacterized protein LOC128461558 n=1 Tax=Pleuronectes platessa TaxID=8262 RepID=UPI00232A61EB|nr:uncharacterized protein LOC128461558 [Pleuronectes platessa]
MKMKMKMKLPFVSIVMVMMSVSGVTTFTPRPRTTTTTWTTARPVVNLDGKMFTLSSNGGGITFYPPSYTPNSPRTKTTTTRRTITTITPKTTTTIPKTTTTTRRTTTTTPKTTTTTPRTTTTTPRTTTTTPKTTTTTPRTTTTTPRTTTTTPKTTTTTPKTTTTTPRTTPFSTTGLSVCLRYLTDYYTTRNPPLLKLFPSSSDPVTLGTSSGVLYSLSSWLYYKPQTFQPSIQFWPGGFSPDIWTRVCVTVDSAKNVGQVFSGSNMSIRKILPYQLPQGNDPVIYVPGFDGQLTDVQMWDYPLSYREIIQYMRPSTYRPSRGSVLTWSDISYSLGGNALLEDTYQMLEQQPISKRGRGRGLRGEKKSRRVFKVEESKKREGGEFQ